MLNERNTLLEDDGIEEEILVEEECSIAQAVWGDIQGNIENQTDLQNALDAKQDSLTEAQLNAVNSGITSEKVTTYDGYADQIASKADQSALNAESTARGEADTALGTRIDNEALARQSADNGLQTQIDAITSKSDVVDVVANYASLQAYDTSTLGNNDVVKVLDDETHEDALTYYRWSTTTQTWTYIGQEAPYYSKGQMDVKLAEKQDKLTAGANIQIQNGTISATDTTYTAGNGLNLNDGEFSADTTVLATKSDLDSYYTKTETDTKLAPKLETEVVAELPSTGTEGKLYLTPKNYTTGTATGNPITISLGEDAGQITDAKLDGDTYQQNYEGKNLWPINSSIPTFNCTITPGDNSLTIVATGANSNIYPQFNLEANTQYTFSGEFKITDYVGASPIGPIIQGFNGSSWTVIEDNRSEVSDTNAHTFSVSFSSASYSQIRVGFGTNVFSSSVANTVVLSNPQLEKGSTATSFEPYVGGQASPSPSYPQDINVVTGTQTVSINGSDYPISLGSIELCKLGTYQDYIWKDGESWKVHKINKRVVFDSQSTFMKIPYGINAYGVVVTDMVADKSNVCVMSEKFTGVAYDSRVIARQNIVFLDSNYPDATSWAIVIRNTPWSSLSALDTWLASNDIECVYTLATATDTAITDQTLIAQLEAIRTASLQNGTNTITNSATAPNLAGDMEVGYYGYNPTNRYDKFIWLDLNNNYEQIGS